MKKLLKLWAWLGWSISMQVSHNDGVQSCENRVGLKFVAKMVVKMMFD